MSRLNIIRGDLKGKPASTQILIDIFEELADKIEGYLYIGYPIIGTNEGGYQIDALLISRNKGIFLFNLIEQKNRGETDYRDIQDDNFNKFTSKLIQHKELLERRKLGFDVQTVTFAPSWGEINYDKDYACLTTKKGLIDYFLSKDGEVNKYYENILSVIQSITSIRKSKSREYIQKTDSKGAKLKKLEDSIANLDSAQSEAVIETVDGVQRIRGLAGSGKSIVLALKVAYLHAKNPTWKIAVTFNTRSLKGQFERFINNFSFSHQGQEPDWLMIDLVHAWGSPKYDGIYYNLCKENNFPYKDFDDARQLSKRYGEEFDLVCKEVIDSGISVKEKYDLIVVDEAQDFSPEFLRICYKLLSKEKRLVYAYDELQSLNNKSMPSPESLFGIDKKGKPLVELKNEKGKPKRDIILYKCYRNSKEILTAAHSLGFGIYRSELVQIFDQPSLWNDIGYKVVDGALEDSKQVILERTPDSSPEFLSDHSDIEDLIKFSTFQNNNEQVDYIVDEIIKNITEDELKPDDIIVINPDPLTTKNIVGVFRSRLFEKGINSTLAGVSSSPDIFFSGDKITFTGINRAKGNEAAMVYLINAQYCYEGFELSKKRNILFTAMTRSKAWLRVCGIGLTMKELEKEYTKVKSAGFKLNFVYPDAQTREHIRIVNRDMSEEEKRLVMKNQEKARDLIQDLRSGTTKIEDLPQELIDLIKSKG